MNLEAFSRQVPEWTKTATHALNLHCPCCFASSRQAQKVWLNRYAPVTTESYTRKYQEFYLCECEKVWWAWSNDRSQKQDNINN